MENELAILNKPFKIDELCNKIGYDSRLPQKK